MKVVEIMARVLHGPEGSAVVYLNNNISDTYLARGRWCAKLVNVLRDKPSVHIPSLEGMVVEDEFVEGAGGGHSSNDSLIQSTEHTGDGLATAAAATTTHMIKKGQSLQHCAEETVHVGDGLLSLRLSGLRVRV